MATGKWVFFREIILNMTKMEKYSIFFDVVINVLTLIYLKRIHHTNKIRFGGYYLN